MAVVPSDFQALLTTGIKALFWSVFNGAETDYETFTTTFPSSTKSQDFNWLGAVPRMRQWKDERQPAGLSPRHYTITADDWETSIEVDRNALQDDQLGQVKTRISDMAKETRRAPREHVLTFLEANSACYDGKAYFATNHSEGKSGTQSNLISGAGTSVANLKTDLLKCKVAMAGYKDDRGRIMDRVGDLIVAPTALWEAFAEVLVATTVSTGGQNIWKGTHTLVTSSLLTDANDWYYFCSTDSVKPLLLLWRDGPNFASLGEGSEEYFMRKRYVFGADARYQAGWGPWQLGIKVTNA